MSVRDLMAVVRRRWYVIVAVLVMAGVGSYLLRDTAGLYTTRTIVSFMLPDKTSLSPDSGLDDSGVIAFAGVVAQEVNDGRAPLRYSTDDAPLFGAGLRQGVLVTLPNAGNQWVTSYQRAEVELQIVGPTEQWVARTQSEMLDRLAQAADAQQASVSAEESKIQVAVVPLTTRIFHIMPSRGEAIAADVALALAALILGMGAARIVDGWVRTLRIRRSRGRMKRGVQPT